MTCHFFRNSRRLGTKEGKREIEQAEGQKEGRSEGDTSIGTPQKKKKKNAPTPPKQQKKKKKTSIVKRGGSNNRAHVDLIESQLRALRENILISMPQNSSAKEKSRAGMRTGRQGASAQTLRRAEKEKRIV